MLLWDIVRIAWAHLEIGILLSPPPECCGFQHGPACSTLLLMSVNEGEQMPWGLNSGRVLKVPGLGKPLFLLEYVFRNCIRTLIKNKLDSEQRDLSYPALANLVKQLIEKGFSRVFFSSISQTATLYEVVRTEFQIAKLWSDPRKHQEPGCRKGGGSSELRATASQYWSTKWLEHKFPSEKCHPESHAKKKTNKKNFVCFFLLVT